MFDIETDGLLRGLTKIHCIVARDIDSDQEYGGTTATSRKASSS